MYLFALILHVIAAALFLGPVSYALIAFPKALTTAISAERRSELVDSAAGGQLRTVYTISRVYGLLSLAAPLLGVAVLFTDFALWRDWRFHLSLMLCAIAWLVLLLFTLPKQRKAMGGLGLLSAADKDEDEVFPTPTAHDVAALRVSGYVFVALWLLVAVLMVI